MKLVEELRERGITLEAAGDRLKFRGPAELVTPALLQRLAEHKAEILAHLHGQQSAEVLEAAVRFARTEAELDRLVGEIQAGFEAGHLSQAQAERLAALTMDTARQLECGLVNIPDAAFLEGER